MPTAVVVGEQKKKPGLIEGISLATGLLDLANGLSSGVQKLSDGGTREILPNEQMDTQTEALAGADPAFIRRQKALRGMYA